MAVKSQHRIRAYLRLARPKAIGASKRRSVRICSVSLILAGLAIAYGKVLVNAIPAWLGTISRLIYAAAQVHHGLARFIHILINAVPDMAFALLAFAGLGYLAPETVKNLEKKPRVRVMLVAFFVLFSFFAIVVNAVKSEDQDHKDAIQTQRVDVVMKSVANIQDALRHKATMLTEAERIQHLTSALRDEFIMTHNPVDPEVLAGSKLPPADWMNERLAERGETYRVSEPRNERITPTIAPTPAKPICPGTDGNIYLTCSDAQFGKLAEDEAANVENLANLSRYNEGSPGWGDHAFNLEFQKCCFDQLTSIRAEAKRRLRPSEFDINEDDAWRYWTSDQKFIGSLTPQYRFEAKRYASYLRAMGKLIERRNTPPAKPIKLAFERRVLSVGTADDKQIAPFEIEVTLRTTQQLASGYIIVKLDRGPLTYRSDFAALMVSDPNESDNKVIQKLLVEVHDGRALVFKIAKTPFSPDSPIHITLTAPHDIQVLDAFWTDEY